MRSIIVNEEEFFALLEDHVVVVANNRQMLFWHDRFRERFRKLELPIYSKHEFISSLIEYLDPKKITISQFQSELIVNKIIAGEDLQPHNISNEVRSAISICKNWLLPNEAKSEAFASWFDAYQQYLADNDLIDQEDLYQLLINNLPASKAVLPKKIAWFGFEHINKPMQDLINAFSKLDLVNIQLKFANRNKVTSHVSSNTKLEQYTKAIIWGAEHLELAPRIIIPELNSHYELVSSLADHYLPEGSFNISNPPKLTELPLLKDLFCFLDSLNGTFSWQKLLQLQNSPYIDLDLDLVCIPTKLEYSWQELLPDPNFTLIYNKTKGSKEPASWIVVLNEIIAYTGLGANLNKNNQEILNKFYGCVKEYLATSLIQPVQSYRDLIKHLYTLASNSVYAPENYNYKLQILGSLEGSGIMFEHLFFCDLEQENWPAKLKPNRLISDYHQREFLCPKSNHSYELKLAKAHINSISNMSRNIIYSYASGSKRSSLTKLVTPGKEIQLKTYIARTSEQLSVYQDQMTLKTNVQTISTTRLNEQAKCPFYGMVKAELLAVYELPDSQHKVKQFRGIVLHSVLNKIYLQQIKDHGRIRALIKKELANDYFVGIYSDYSYMLLEADLLFELVKLVLLLEQDERPVKLELEQTFSCSLHQVEMVGRIDRLDHYQDRSVLIDYKTGTFLKSELYGSRPTSLQIPIYNFAFTPKEIEIWQIKPKGVKRINVPIANDWGDKLSALIQEIKQGVASVAPVNSSVCKQCELVELCRVRRS